MSDAAEDVPPKPQNSEPEPILFVTDAERAEIRRLVEKERALRDVANLIGSAGADVDIIAIIVREASRQVDGLPITLTQFVGPRDLFVRASPDGPAEPGMRIVSEPDTLPDRVFRSGLPVRVDDYRREPDAELAARFGIFAAIAVPIVVEGRVWGMFFVSSSVEQLPPDTEALLSAFAQLVTASFDSIEARDQLRTVAEHDEAMRVIQRDASGASITEVSSRLVEYASMLSGVEHATLTVIGGVVVSATNPVVSISKPSVRPAQTMAFPVTAQHNALGVLSIETTLPGLPTHTIQFLNDLSEVTGRIILAITNRQQLSELIDEQASLRRIAELAARGVPRAGPMDDILAAICRAASDQLNGQEVTLLQFESADTVVAVATYASSVPPGTRIVHPPGSMSDRIAHAKATVRVDDFDSVPSAAIVRRYGIRAGVGVPVFIEDRVWGAFVATSQIGPLPRDSESRLEGFAKLTWAAIANAEARESLRRLADEQAALRHVAELVARESPLPAVLEAVVEQAARVLDASSATVAREYHNGLDEPRVVAEVKPQATRGAHRAEVPILVNGELWGVLTVSSDAPSRMNARDRLKPFADLLAAAITNSAHRDGLTQSRARVIAAADEARRRLQRDVHDGAQQGLVNTILMLKLAMGSAGGADAELLAEALSSAEEANRQLRDIVRGILPAALTRSGLAAGIRSLVADTQCEVDLKLDIPRLPAIIETTGYFTVAEAITNAVKHAQATRLTVSCVLSSDGDELILIIEDDGVGGADPSRGTGLTGLKDRIEASNGTLEIEGTAHGGTRIVARIPTATPRAPAD
ncbi:GAF domain-containing protein [Lacisediminihabitans changchengi]|uniref:GAF domain-containing protein n=1 Tax=Lacisediminihabitans changchengi TaxID=2787634 RepID=UPI0027DCE18A|nr:GAF domain-containing protein [Lacisediminihabitans changchengi]